MATANSWAQAIGLFAFVDTILGAWETLKGWWNSFKGFLAGLNPFGPLIAQANQLIGVLNSVTGLSIGGISMPSGASSGAVSTGVAAAKGGIGAKITNNSSGGKNTNVTVHNYGQKMNGATLAHEMRMAGG